MCVEVENLLESAFLGTKESRVHQLGEKQDLKLKKRYKNLAKTEN